MKDNTEQIRELLKKAIIKGSYYPSKKPPHNRVELDAALFEEALSLLPPPCSECGSCKSNMYCTHERKMTHNKNGECPDYRLACQPAGEVEEFVKIAREWYCDNPNIIKLCGYLTALLKQIEQQDEDIAGFQNDFFLMDEQIEELKAENPWILASSPPDKIDWEKKVLVLECESEIPAVMTMAEVFLNEGSEIEYWKPIILPAQALQGQKEKDGKEVAK